MTIAGMGLVLFAAAATDIGEEKEKRREEEARRRLKIKKRKKVKDWLNRRVQLTGPQQDFAPRPGGRRYYQLQ